MWHSKSIEDISKTLNTNIKTGLSNSCASKLLNENGKNELTEGTKRSLIKLIFYQIKIVYQIIDAKPKANEKCNGKNP